MTSWCDYKIKKVVGKGSFGVVYLVQKKNTNQKYALKKINLENMHQYDKRNLVNEIKILASHNCPFIIGFVSVFVYLGSFCIITEYASKGDLYVLIKNKETNNVKFTEDEILHYLSQICTGINYLHKNNIAHRDLKSANIFVDMNNNIKIGDFGVIKILKAYMMYAQTQVGTPLYMSPEIFKRERYTTKIDIWSLGCILHELMTLKPAFTSHDLYNLKRKIFAGKINILNYNYSMRLKNLLTSLLNVNPRLRPSIIKILDNDLIKDYLSLTNIGITDFKLRQIFYENCIVPRKIVDWNFVIKKYLPSSPIILPSIYITKEVKYDKKDLPKIEEELARLTIELEEANNIVAHKIRRINLLQCKRRVILDESTPITLTTL